ncbi:11926_t:CDS:2, partial [Gigaspora rosea]
SQEETVNQNLGKTEEIRLTKKHKMDIDMEIQVLSSVKSEALNTQKTDLSTLNTLRGDGCEMPGSEIEPRTNSQLGEEAQISSQISTEVTNNSIQNSAGKETAEGRKAVKKGEQGCRWDTNDSMKEEYLSQPEESNLTKLMEAEKDELVSVQNSLEHNKENHVDGPTPNAETVEKKESKNRQALSKKSQNMDKDGFITVTHKKKPKVKNKLPEAFRIIGLAPYKKVQTYRA